MYSSLSSRGADACGEVGHDRRVGERVVAVEVWTGLAVRVARGALGTFTSR